MCYQILALWMIGYADQALALAAKMTARARHLAHANTTCYAGLHHAVLAMLCRDDPLLESINNEVMAIAEEHGMFMWRSYFSMSDALLRLRHGDNLALPRLQSAKDEYQADGARLWMTLYLSEEAAALMHLGDTAQASAVVQQALALAEATDERWMEAELYRIEGEICLRQADRERAQDAFLKAIETARRQGARLFELRASTSLARHCANQAAKKKARERLQSVYDGFTEGFDIADLKDAKALLRELA